MCWFCPSTIFLFVISPDLYFFGLPDVHPSTTYSWESSWVDHLDTTELSGEFANSSWFENRVQDFRMGFWRTLQLNTRIAVLRIFFELKLMDELKNKRHVWWVLTVCWEYNSYTHILCIRSHMLTDISSLNMFRSCPHMCNFGQFTHYLFLQDPNIGHGGDTKARYQSYNILHDWAVRLVEFRIWQCRMYS